jgi:hypothetical protein
MAGAATEAGAASGAPQEGAAAMAEAMEGVGAAADMGPPILDRALGVRVVPREGLAVAEDMGERAAAVDPHMGAAGLRTVGEGGSVVP